MNNQKPHKNSAMRSALLGGLVPVILFTVIENYFGTLWGLVAGMVFGVGEIFWEWHTQRRVERLTWIGNGMILFLGGISLFTHEGIWFKLQPALLELGTAGLLIGSNFTQSPFLIMMAEKQGMFERIQPEAVEIFRRGFRGINFRLGIFFLIHAVIATWAAYSWTTAQWAMLKGIGLTVSMVVYFAIEMIFLRRKLKTEALTRKYSAVEIQHPSE